MLLNLRSTFAARLAAVAVCALGVLAGCYLPTRFAADITINEAGDWTLTFNGEIASAGLTPGLMPDRPTPAQLEERVKSITNDLTRDPGFTAVQYRGNGRFQVAYQRTGNIFRQPGITFIRTDSRILQISYIKKDNEITIKGNTVPNAQRQWVRDAGVDMNGDLRITTAMTVKDHNAQATQPAPGGATLYTWAIRGLDQPAPRLVIAVPE